MNERGMNVLYVYVPLYIDIPGAIQCVHCVGMNRRRNHAWLSREKAAYMS